jgi:hypothetical protein
MDKQTLTTIALLVLVVIVVYLLACWIRKEMFRGQSISHGRSSTMEINRMIRGMKDFEQSLDDVRLVYDTDFDHTSKNVVKKTY